MVMPGGSKAWFNNGRLHRLGGPATEMSNGHRAFYVNGREFTEEEFYRYVDQDTSEVLVPPGKRLYYDK